MNHDLNSLKNRIDRIDARLSDVRSLKEAAARRVCTLISIPAIICTA
jgi:hypothetical protein